MRGLRNQTERLIKRRRVRRKHVALICLLGLVVVVATSAFMRLPAFTQRKPTFCGMEEHQHTSECDVPGSSCTAVEHVHDLSCYSDPTADVQTETDWVLSLPQDEEALPFERIVAIARSQLGYSESERNYEVRENGNVAGYTRYGAWDGSPYEDWDAAFVAFCLEYANVDAATMPRAHDANAWMDTLKTVDLYEDHAVSPYVPLMGDLVFFSYDDGHTIDEWNVDERNQTFTACFAPDGQYLITFDKYIWADEYGRVHGSVQQGGAKTYAYIDEDGTTRNVYFCYSNSDQGAVAVPDDNGKFVGWYRVDTGALVCESASFVPPQDLSENIIVQARFVEAELLNVRYYSYNSQGGAYVGDVSVRGGSAVGKDLYEQVYEQRSPSGAVAYDASNYSFVAWRDEAGKIVTRDHELSDLPAATRDVAYRAEYLATRTSRILVTVGTPGTGKVCQGVNDQTDQWIGWGNVVQSGSYITLKNSLTVSASDGYRFDHWEFNGVELDTHNDTLTFVDKPITSNHIQELKAVFVPICTITFNVGVIQQVGINAPDFQHWEDVPWCSKSVQVESPAILDIVGEDLYSQSVETGSWFMLPNLATNTPDGTQTIRVSQTNNGYNLLTHTFRGWRQKDGDGTIYAAGTWMPAQDSVEYEAVWDAYLPGKSGYYGTEVGAYRYNTNTCGFFVRLFGSTFNIDDTGTYTDCLFTSRIFVGGQSLFATSDGVSGKRMDFFGNSNANERQQIDLIDSQLRFYANTSIPYSEEYSGQNNGTAYPGSLITFEQPFPSDEFIFSRIRAWNASIGQDRKIRINGTLIPQDKLIADYFDLRWYVLKDQENSWHVDGMLIPKYAKLVVTKRFDGSEVAIQSIKNSGNFYIGVTRDKSKTENTSLSEEYRLRLHWHSDQDTNADMGYYLSDNGTYTWVIDTLEPLSTYWVAEHYY